MPELPEVETIVRGLRPRLPGRRVRSVEVVHGDVLAEESSTFRGRLEGRSLAAVDRRGKNVIVALEPPGALWVNLGMTGVLLPDPPSRGPGAPTHPAVRIFFGDGGVLVYDDVRRFGRLEVLGEGASRRRGEALGPEPLSEALDPARLETLLAASRAPIRSWLLDQKKVAGVGNIYANEALHRARIHPKRPARTLNPEEVSRLHRALRKVLRSAIEAGGTTIRDFRDAGGGEGAFGTRLRAYGREGEPCLGCGGEIRRIVFGGRSAFLCPRCQRETGADGEAPGGRPG